MCIRDSSTVRPGLGELDHAWPTGTAAVAPSSVCRFQSHSATPHTAPGRNARSISSVGAAMDRLPTVQLLSSTLQVIYTARRTAAAVEVVRQAAALSTS